MNPKRELTLPSEPYGNDGYDNAECDYILRVSDFIFTPEGKEYFLSFNPLGMKSVTSWGKVLLAKW